MGSGFVSAMLSRGEKVTVWNRTISRAELLAADGAQVANNPASAVRGASRVHLALLDDAAVDDVIGKLLPGLESGAVIVDHSTTATQPTAVRAERLKSKGVRFLHAPVLMGPGNARDATGMILVSGPPEIFEEVRPELERMTGKVRYFGARTDLAAAYKLFGNMMVMFIVGGTADIFSLARGVGVDPNDAITLFSDFNPIGQITGRGKRMAEGKFSPAAFELVAARKDVRLMLDSARDAGASLHMLPAIARRFDEVIAAGYGQDDLAAVGADIP
jgi:3-hydroxyisobutyrate dehydrogenase